MSSRFLPKLYLLIFLSGIALLAAAYYFEYVLGLEPCPLCMTQRLATLVIAVCFLLATIRVQFVSALILILALVASLGGLYIADHHVYLQSLPPERVPACGPDLAYMLETLPFSKLLNAVLQGDGHCAEIVWSFWGLSMPQWTRICFTIYALLAIVSLYFTLKAKKAR